MATMAAVPSEFGSGGQGISPSGSMTSLKALLEAAHVDILAAEARLATLEGSTDRKASVRIATTANINLATTGLTAIDGVTPVAGDRVLVKDQSTGSQNGIYVAAAGAWARAADADASADVTAGMEVFVSEGTVNGNETFVLTTDDAITLGTTALTFTKRPTLAELASTSATKGAALIGYDGGTTVKAALDANVALQKRTVTVGHADLTEAANGATQAINIGAALPANARIVGVDMRSMTAFSGGGATAVTVDVGTAGDVDALVDGADLFAAAVDGGPATMPPGVRPNKTMGAVQLIATFAPDGGHNLDGLTAGSIVIDVLFSVLA